MSRHGYDPFGSDEAIDVQDHLHGLADPLPVLVQVLEAVHAEDSLILPDVAEAGLAAAGEVALLLDPALDPSFPRLPVPVDDDRLRTIALEVMESLVQPWDRRTGACCLYGLWRDPDGDAHYRRALEPYLRALAAGARTCLDPPHDPGYSWTTMPPRDARRARADDEERPGPSCGRPGRWPTACGTTRRRSATAPRPTRATACALSPTWARTGCTPWPSCRGRTPGPTTPPSPAASSPRSRTSATGWPRRDACAPRRSPRTWRCCSWCATRSSSPRCASRSGPRRRRARPGGCQEPSPPRRPPTAWRACCRSSRT
ncbi:hypothetical protein ACBI99_39845 [Nonomuraea sp. ATR24]|uniref:hypothetical protein n=1 Tax=Nonomuraea sp. ATR24 TaxID=1676744 RepID=UPI0035C1BA5D